MATLRDVLPLPLDELADVARLLVELVVRLHARGHAHGHLSLDDVIVTTSPAGSVEVALSPPRAGSERHDDVIALGAVLAAALQRSCTPSAAAGAPAQLVANAAHLARRSAIDPAVDARAVLQAFDAARSTAPAGGGGRQPAPRNRQRRAAVRPLTVLVLWIGLLVATVTVLPRLAPAVSPPPVLGGADELREWLTGRDVVTGVVGALRLGVHGLALYLLASTALSIAVHIAPSRARHRHALVDRATAAPVRRLVHAALGVGLTVGALTTATTGTGTRTRVPAVAEDVAAERRAQPGASTSTSTSAPARAPEVGEPAALAPPGPQTWTVRPGDSLWSIAERRMAAGGAGDVDERALTRYWLDLIETNRHVLVVPDVPDLILPGQVLRLPPLGSEA